jgi:plasmid stabilization system protein ParE
MSLTIVLRRQARREFDEAADWYEQHRPGLGARFTAAVQDVFDEIATNPQRYAVVHKDVREGLVKGFPYCVYYREQRARIVVLAVFHTSRDPSLWQARA